MILSGARATPSPAVLIDSSLWVEYYRPNGSAQVQAELKELVARGQVGTTAMIAVEVVRGALTEEGYETLDRHFAALDWLDASSGAARRGSRIGFVLERLGMRVPATDLLIAGVAIEHGYALWHNDAHFEVIAQHSELSERRLGVDGHP